MQYYILTIDSLNTTFSTVESGSEIKFKIHFTRNIGDFDNINSGDFILGYKKGQEIIKYLFKINEIDIENHDLELEKILDISFGAKVKESNLLEKLENQEITRISECEFYKFYNALSNSLKNLDGVLRLKNSAENFFDKDIDYKIKCDIEHVLKNYKYCIDNFGNGSANPMYDFIGNKFPKDIQKIINNDHYLISGVTGSPNFPKCASLSILDKNLTLSTQKGLYVSYYFEKCGNYVYLSLVWGDSQFDEINNSDFSMADAVENMKNFINNSNLSYLNNFDLDNDPKLAIDDNLEGTCRKYQNSIIICKKYCIDEGIPSDYDLIKDLDIFLQLYDFIKKNYDGKYKFLLESSLNNYEDGDYVNIFNFDEDFDCVDRLSCGKNILLYGVPGSGKSWKIKNEICLNVPESCMERVVFHPDYTYSDFIGQILPILDKKQITYDFIPGPFTNILRESYIHPDKEFFLIIEEINRGNAPAIFGDIFQLLDRKKEEGDDCFPICTSEFGITSSNIADKVYGDENKKVRIPSNLSIIATMNTSDQNVFTLDTAFQRRWNMELIENKIDNEKDNSFNQDPILDIELTWKQFCYGINKKIIEENYNISSSEDKRMGTYFIKAEDFVCEKRGLDNDTYRRLVKEKSKIFSEKVLKYLWDDAFKFSREKIFNTKDYDTLDLVIKKFINSEGKEKKFEVFVDGLYDKLKIDFEIESGG